MRQDPPAPRHEPTNGPDLSMLKQRETKEDGRYIIFYTFADDRPDDTPEEDA